MLSTNQANSFASSVQDAKTAARAQNNAVMDSYHQAVQEKRTSDYVQGATDTFQGLKAVSSVKDAISLNSDKYKPAQLGKKVATGILGEETGAKVGRAAGAVSGVVTGGVDLIEDIKSGGVVGDNVAKQAQNIGDIIGGGLTAIALVDPVLAPLALLGTTAELGAAVSGGIGDVIDAVKSGKAALTDEQSELTQSKLGQSLAQSGQVAVARSE